MHKNVGIISDEYLALSQEVERLSAALAVARAKRNAVRTLLVRHNVDVSTLTRASNKSRIGNAKAAPKPAAPPPVDEEEHIEEFTGPDDPAWIAYEAARNASNT